MGCVRECVSAAPSGILLLGHLAILGSRLAGGKAERAPVPRGCVPAAWMAGPCSTSTDCVRGARTCCQPVFGNMHGLRMGELVKAVEPAGSRLGRRRTGKFARLAMSSCNDSVLQCRLGGF